MDKPPYVLALSAGNLADFEKMVNAYFFFQELQDQRRSREALRANER